MLVTLLIVAIVYWLLGKTFADQPNNRLYRQLAYVGLFVVSQVVLVIALPFEDSTQNQLLTLFGYVLTAVIALASTSFVSNAMAGLMLKATGAFHNGDFIHVGDHFGRVTTKSLLHTAVQSEDRDTITLPNLYVISNPVKVVDQSGTIISAELSIGFDTHRRRVREHLIAAAEAAELQEPFVHIMDIGDYAVRYKVAGFLEDISTLVTKRSELRSQMLDKLHQAGVEVMTPSVMNQRPLPADTLVIPKRELSPEAEADSGQAEKLMFDKAELAARVQRFTEQRDTLKAELKAMSEDPDTNPAEIRWREHQLAALDDIIARFESNDG